METSVSPDLLLSEARSKTGTLNRPNEPSPVNFNEGTSPNRNPVIPGPTGVPEPVFDGGPCLKRTAVPRLKRCSLEVAER